ncbi:MAG: pirin family protein, partial [Rhodocyclaceae bacterium]|nr:pirin family protein [Rhodocyclaceae bacterium]
LYLGIHLPAGASFAEALPAGHNAFVVPYRGAVTVAGTQVSQGRMALLGNAGDGVVLRANGGPAKAVLIAGRPLNEPIVQHGPFVMNSQEEILQAFRDYRDGRFA